MIRYISFSLAALFSAALFSGVQAQPLSSLNDNQRGAGRTLCYTPDGEDFVIVNGDRKFNRALYGSHDASRVETGDVPEFALYLPRMGGNLSFGLVCGKDSIALNEASRIESRYRAGSRVYTIEDPLLQGGRLILTALALADKDGGIWQIRSEHVPEHARLTWRFGGASDKRFSREGDMGVDPPDSFDLKPEYCQGNEYTLSGNTFSLRFGQHSGTGERMLYGSFPEGSRLGTDDWPVLYGTVLLSGTQYLALSVDPAIRTLSLADEFSRAEESRRALAARIRFHTPDPWFNPLGGALAVAADGIWDGQVWLHGAVGWRMPLSGWRAAYTGDALGWHDRARKHFNAYAASQVTEVPQTISHPAQDPEINLARSEKRWGTPQYSNGYICRNPYRNDQMHHYDMNLCYIDELLWHLNWTGDLEYARQMWPVITRHLEWEKRNYDPDDDGLYDAYVCIWASDALYYNSGAVTHSTAYNYRAHKMAALIAGKIGEDPEPYRREAEKIRKALNDRLWMSDRGHWAEYQDFMGHQRLHPNAGLWTIYHAIDGETADPFQAWQATRYVDTEIPHIPVRAAGLPDGRYTTLSTTNWLPYAWSVNNVAFAEVMHTALAYFQAGRREEGFHLLKSSVLDGMYLGGSPGNFGQISFYDAARGECYRDFGDPIGVASRVFIQGLFGILPDALNETLVVRPGFPDSWPFAELETPDVSFTYSRQKEHAQITENYTLTHQLPTVQRVVLEVPARKSKLAAITCPGNYLAWQQLPDAIGEPMVRLEVLLPPEKTASFILEWTGDPLPQRMEYVYMRGESLRVSLADVEIQQVYDPQQVWTEQEILPQSAQISGRVGGIPGHRIFFVQVKQDDMLWWLPVPVEIREPEQEHTADFSRVQSAACEPVSIAPHFNASVTDIFRNTYLTPRSPYTTLQLPVQGIGEWCHPQTMAEIDDSGLRAQIARGIFQTGLGVDFFSPAEGDNIVFTSLWDNYPDSVRMALSGRASRAYLMMAGSTNHMQCHLVNGVVRVYYTDGSAETLQLINPDNWCPIEQDFFVDDQAFSLRRPRPYRVHLKSGLVSNDLEQELNITGVYGRAIDGGAGVLLEMSLDPEKELSHLILETLSNDVVIGLMGVTLQR
ncbi:MAG: DUF4450 domain-containing protein [Bacteroides sp.]|nr:DUF4450 domain-containing protein [Bacteroides sp.]